MGKTFSVVLATYKQAEKLRFILRALEEQTFKDFEVILCDDGSTDYELLKEPWAFDLRYVWQQDDGFRAARSKNNGIKVADGKYVVYLEGDVLPTKRWLEAFASESREDKVLIGIRHTANDIADPEHTIRFKDERLETLSQIHTFTNPWRLVSGCNLCIPKKALLEVGMNDESFVGHGWDDWYLAAKLYRAGYKLTPCFDAVAYHIWHEMRDSPSANKERCLALEQEIVMERIERGEVSPDFNFKSLWEDSSHTVG